MEIASVTAKVASIDNIKKLNALYDGVPSGKYKSCTNCCSESVNISFLELSNVIENGLPNLTEDQMETLTKRIIAYYLLEWVKPQKCPFLDEDKRCMIYTTRPLPCRIFGTPKREAYEQNYKQIQRQNKRVAQQIQLTYGSRLPSCVVNRKIDFCEDFIPESRLDGEAIENLTSRLINWDGALYFEDLIDETAMNGDLVNWILQWLIETQVIVTKELLFELKKDCLKSIQK